MTKKEEEQKISHVYLRDEANGEWMPALQLRVHDGKATVAVPVWKNEQEMLNCPKRGPGKYERDNRMVDLRDYANHVLPMANVDANGRLEEYKDMVELPFLHEVSRCMHSRYLRLLASVL